MGSNGELGGEGGGENGGRKGREARDRVGGTVAREEATVEVGEEEEGGKVEGGGVEGISWGGREQEKRRKGRR